MYSYTEALNPLRKSIASELYTVLVKNYNNISHFLKCAKLCCL